MLNVSKIASMGL